MATPKKERKSPSVPIDTHPLRGSIIDQGIRDGNTSTEIAAKVNCEVDRLHGAKSQAFRNLLYVTEKAVRGFMGRVGAATEQMRSGDLPTPAAGAPPATPAQALAWENDMIKRVDIHNSFLFAFNRLYELIKELADKPARDRHDHRNMTSHIREFRESAVAYGKAIGALGAAGELNEPARRLVRYMADQFRQIGHELMLELDESRIGLFHELWEKHVANNPKLTGLVQLGPDRRA